MTSSATRPLIEPFDLDRVEIGSLFSVGGGPWGRVVEVLAGGWPTPAIRVWVDYGTHVACHIAVRTGHRGGEIGGGAQMILRPCPGLLPTAVYSAGPWTARSSMQPGAKSPETG